MMTADPVWFETVSHIPAGTLAGDVDRSGSVERIDLVRVFERFGSQVADQSPADIDGDGVVGLKDIIRVRNQLGASATAAATLASGERVSVASFEWIVQLTDEAVTNWDSPRKAASGLAQYGIDVVQGLGASGQLLVRTPTADIADADALLSRLGLFESHAPNSLGSADSIPNDPRFAELWGEHNTGQAGGRTDADIDAPEAWDYLRTGEKPVIGVIDTGIDYRHPDLNGNMWVNTRETPGNGRDDDQNGFVDDYYGYDFANDDGDPIDDHGHGTHVAGTIGAVWSNGVGVAGVAPDVRLMALKWISANNFGWTSNAVKAVNYATMMRQQGGVNIVATNNSWSVDTADASLRKAIADSGAAGILFVAAAGNDSSSNDLLPVYPASFPLGNIISVAATDRSDNLAIFSNFGMGTVDLAAPGQGILSTVPGNGYAAWNGTSMAAPHVTGVIALAKSIVPNATSNAIRDAIFASVDPLSSLQGKVASGGRLNARKALERLVPTPSISVGDCVASESNGNSATCDYTVRLSSPAATEVQFTVQTVSGSATAGDDFVASNSTVVIPGGITSVVRSVPLRGDVVYERDEYFQIVVSNAHGATIGDGNGIGTILNDDPLPSLTISDCGADEGNIGTAACNFVVQLSAPSAFETAFTLTTRQGTATSGRDYLPAQQRVSIAAGNMSTIFAIQVAGDLEYESDELFYLDAGNIEGAIAGKITGVGIIRDDELQQSKAAVVRNGHTWYFDVAGDGYLAERTVGFGLPGDVPLSGDVNGDGYSELIVVRPNPQRGGLDWYIDLDGDGYLQEQLIEFGLLGMTPLIGDVNGDGRDDLTAVARNTATGLLDWYFDVAGDGYLAEQTLSFGLHGDVPVLADFDGNGRADAAAVRHNVQRGGLDWYLDLANDGIWPERTVEFGLPGFIPVAGDVDDDGTADLGAVTYNPIRGGLDWHFDTAGDGYLAEKIIEFGLAGDVPVMGRWRETPENRDVTESEEDRVDILPGEEGEPDSFVSDSHLNATLAASKCRSGCRAARVRQIGTASGLPGRYAEVRIGLSDIGSAVPLALYGKVKIDARHHNGQYVLKGETTAYLKSVDQGIAVYQYHIPRAARHGSVINLRFRFAGDNRHHSAIGYGQIRVL